MEAEGSRPHSQEPATCPSRKPDRSIRILRYTYFNGNLHDKKNMIFERKFFILLHQNF